ncbi:flagellar hook-associated protein FlgK [Muricoccus vinaceus]|uniref:Flagellar hook-associated protein 1 n=1 Tax=Muricoccus vinaceus TaxID=424704 RepID=A0ABV6ISQ6_9PROT
MSLDTALLNAGSGLRLASRQLANASNNVANAATVGYSRKQVDGLSLTMGGVRTLDPQRDIDPVMRSEMRRATGQEAAAGLRNDTLARLSQLQGDPSDGSSIGGLMGALRDSFTSLSDDPANGGKQTASLEAARSLAGRMNTIGSSMSQARQGVQDGLRDDVDSANGLLRDVSRLDRLVRNEVAAGRSAAELLDQRDAAVSSLSGLLDITPVPASNSGITLMLPSGATLPLDPEASPLSLADVTVSDHDYHGKPDGRLPGLAVNGVPLSATSGLGGRIGEGFKLRDETIPRMQAELDVTAATLAGRLEKQGLRLFTDAGGSPAPDPSAPGAGPAMAGFASRIQINPEVAGQPRLLRDGTAASGGFTPNPANGPSGFTALLDRVNDYAFGAQSAAGVAHPPIPGTGLGPGGTISTGAPTSGRITDFAATVTGRQSAEAAAAKGDAGQATAVRAQLGTLVQQREGVDVDAEMASMVQLQNAYAANARVMSAVQDMWDALLASVR